MFSVLPAVAFQLWAWQEKARGRRILFQRSKRWQEEREKSQDREEGTLWDSKMEGRQNLVWSRIPNGHHDSPANGQAVIFLTGFLEVFQAVNVNTKWLNTECFSGLVNLEQCSFSKKWGTRSNPLFSCSPPKEFWARNWNQLWHNLQKITNYNLSTGTTLSSNALSITSWKQQV